MAKKSTNSEMRSAQGLSSLQLALALRYPPRPPECDAARALPKLKQIKEGISKRQKIRDSTNVEEDRGTMLGSPISRSGDAGNAERPTRLEHARDCSARDHTDVTTNATESALLDPPVEGSCHTTPPPASATFRVAAASSPSVYIVVQAFPVPPPPTQPTAVPASYISCVAPQVEYGHTDEDSGTRDQTIATAATPKEFAHGSPSVLSLNVGTSPSSCLQRKTSTGDYNHVDEAQGPSLKV
ncbi:hypothetical protein ON010_g9607 [Phytophthora cinnamomi]|nr:hypothetical protein ON010_g9607 [Phytophthora cinnamomi]